MDPAIGVGLLWILFGGTHIGLATGRLRGALVGRLGAHGFTLFYSVVAAASFTLLTHYFANHRFEGTAGLGLAAVPALRWIAMGAMGLGLMLMSASLFEYARSPMAVFATAVDPPRGIERVTRHAFFNGVLLLSVSHVLLSSLLVGAIYWGGFGLLAAIGAVHQDAKLLALRGRAYADYQSVTSTLPFAAILAGRQRLVLRELPLRALALGLVLTFLLRWVHAGIFAHGGVWVYGTVLAGAASGSLQSWLRSRRAPLPDLGATPDTRERSPLPSPTPRTSEEGGAPWTA